MGGKYKCAKDGGTGMVHGMGLHYMICTNEINTQAQDI